MHFISKRAVILGVVASLGFAGTAQAATDGTAAQLTGGANAMTTNPLFSDFTSTALTGAAQGKSTEIADWVVNDARGTGAGYTVTMAASALLDGATEMVGATLTVTAPTAGKAVGNDSAAPTTSGGNISGGASPAIVTAAADQALGAWTYAQDADDLTIAIPASARVGSYASTITTTLSTDL